MKTIYEEMIGDALIVITAEGQTEDVPPQHYGHLTSTNTKTYARKRFVLMFDDGKCLITSGLEDWTSTEERALLRAGFSF